MADCSMASAATQNSSLGRAATHASLAELQSASVPTAWRTAVGFVPFVRDDPEALSVRVLVADRAGVDGHLPECPAREHPDAVALFARVVCSDEDVRQGCQEVELRWEERDALREELLERLSGVHKTGLNDLLSAVVGGKTLLLVPG